ncbi:MAG: hypothetical protein DDG58_00985 [Ardenticatenia bacterium]|nr:MAG: hypothetical protein DDG58_00985 [Ardenticatenia bacterium]
MKWLTRVPERVGLAQQRIAAVSAEEMQPALQEGYRYLEVCTSWGGVCQRWLAVWSAETEQRERAILQKQVAKEKERAEKAWQVLRRREFSSPEEAAAAVRALEKK